jgi:hypothetical protein
LGCQTVKLKSNEITEHFSAHSLLDGHEAQLAMVRKKVSLVFTELTSTKILPDEGRWDFKIPRRLKRGRKAFSRVLKGRKIMRRCINSLCFFEMEYSSSIDYVFFFRRFEEGESSAKNSRERMVRASSSGAVS